MKDFLKKNFTIVIAFSLPILLIAIVALSSILPSLWLKTNYNFLYSTCDNSSSYYYYCDNFLEKKFSVVDGKLAVHDVDLTKDPEWDSYRRVDGTYTARLFLHDTQRNETREISLEEAESLDLDKLLTSPDGVTVSNHYDRGVDVFMMFGSGSSYGYYLTKGSSKTKLNLVNSDDRYYYRNNFQFIGWTLPGRN